MMTNLTWKKAKPTLPGHYWFRIAGVIQPDIRQVGVLDDQLWVLRGGELVAELGDDVEFAGPIDLPEEPVVTADRQSWAKKIEEQQKQIDKLQKQIDKLQKQIDKLIKTNNANNTGALRLCDHVLDLNRLLEKKASKEELDERCNKMTTQVLEGFTYMKDTLVKILKD